MEKGPLFPFSFGLSYTEHEYQALDYKILGDTIITEVKITNVGNFDADKVVQLYISSPLAGKGYPLHQLSSFKRVKLKSGETSIVGLKLTKGNFTQIDESGREFIPKGDYEVTVGNAVPTKRSIELGALLPLSLKIDSSILQNL